MITYGRYDMVNILVSMETPSLEQIQRGFRRVALNNEKRKSLATCLVLKLVNTFLHALYMMKR